MYCITMFSDHGPGSTNSKKCMLSNLACLFCHLQSFSKKKILKKFAGTPSVSNNLDPGQA